MSVLAKRRVAGATALMILMYLIQVVLFAPSAQADHALPHTSGNPTGECGWMGEGSISDALFKKYQYNASFSGPEGSADVTVALSAGGFTYTNNEASLLIYRIVLKVGQGVGADQVLGDHNVAQSGELAIPAGLSHVTFCLWAPPTTSSTSSSTSSSSTSSSSTSSSSTTSSSTTSSSTTSTPATTPTTTPTTITFDSVPEEVEAEVLGTTITSPPEVAADTLPFTGFDTSSTAGLGLLTIAAGVLLLFALGGRKDRDLEPGVADLGGWSSL